MTEAPQPGRACGTCTMCCKVFVIPELEKPAGTWCMHVRQGAGCSIHAARPDRCRRFFCLWMTSKEPLPPEMKPERSKFVLTTSPHGFLYVQVDPGSPQAWRRSPYHGILRRWARDNLKKGRHVVVFVNDVATLVMPDQDVPLGKMNPSEGFSVRQTFGPNGMTYEVVRSPQASSG
jgi:hypothetical protein